MTRLGTWRRRLRRSALCASAWSAAATAAVISAPAASAAPTVYGGDGGRDRGPFVLQLNPGDGLDVGLVAFDLSVSCPGFDRALDISDELPLVSPRIRAQGNALYSGPPTAEGDWDASGFVSYRLGRYDLDIDETITGKITGASAAGTFRAKAKLYVRRTGRVAFKCRTARHAWHATSAPGRIFGGSTADRLPVVIELAADGASVQRARAAGWARCRPGFYRTISAWRKMDLGDDGRFSRSTPYTQRSGKARSRGRQSITGRVDGTVARGRFKDGWRTRYANGDTETCTTGSVRFTARSSPTG